jgi:hypothetical protein
MISVNDKLPDSEGCYLVYAPHSFPKNSKFVVAEFYADNKTFYSESNDQPMKDVTHWMCLPCDPITEGGGI